MTDDRGSAAGTEHVETDSGSLGASVDGLFRRSSFSVSRAGVGLAAIALFAGLLFWTKLRLTADIPRSAYAVPEAVEDDRTDEGPDNGPDAREDRPDEAAEGAGIDAAEGR